MRRVIRHPKDLLDDLGDPRRRPPVAPKTEGFRPASEQHRKLAQLLVGQCCNATWGRTATQGFHTAAFTSAFEPLADRALGDA